MSATVMEKIVAGCRTECHQVFSVEPTAITAKNK